MPHLFIRYKVNSFDQWRSVWDEDAANRKSLGSTGAQIFKDIKDPNMVSVLIELKDEDSLRRFVDYLQSPEMEEIKKKAGTDSVPDAVHVFDDGERTES